MKQNDEKMLKPLTDEDRLSGKTKPDVYTITELNAFSNKTVYEVSNIALKNKPTLMYGDFIGSFIDIEAKKALEQGAKKVESKGYLIKLYVTKKNEKSSDNNG